MKANFNEEVMLAGWSETHNGGAKVTFWLADSASLEAFKTMTVAKGKTAGQRMAMCLVEIADDEQPVQRTQATTAIAQVEAIKKSPQKTGLTFLAVQWCKKDEFWDWASENFATPTIVSEKEAKIFVCNFCEIQSRKELNTNKKAAKKFNYWIREPYMELLKNK